MRYPTAYESDIHTLNNCDSRDNALIYQIMERFAQKMSRTL